MSLRGALATWQAQGDHDRDCHASLAMKESLNQTCSCGVLTPQRATLKGRRYISGLNYSFDFYIFRSLVLGYLKLFRI